MIRTASSAWALAIAVLLAGCAAKPAAVPERSKAVGSCIELDLAMASAADAKRMALESQQNAWKAIVPFAVVSRHAKGRQAVAAADQRLAQLEESSARLGCPGHVRS